MEAKIDQLFLVSPSNCIGNMLGVSAEIIIEFVAEVSFQRGGKYWQIIKNVVSRRRTLEKKKLLGSKLKRMN